MIQYLKRLPVVVQFGGVLAVAVFSAVFCVYQVGSAMHIAEARSQARALAEMVVNVGSWASQYKGLWVKSDAFSTGVGDYLEQQYVAQPSAARMSADGEAPISEAVAFHQKNPALIQRELADVTRASAARAKFRITSDRPMNPDNASARFELAAMEQLKAKHAEEYIEIVGGELLYAKPVLATAACLRCHESTEKAPDVIRTKYGSSRGFGYVDGELAGVISVSVPLDYAAGKLVESLGRDAWISVALLCAALLCVLVFVHFGVICPIRKIQHYAESVARTSGGDVVAEEFVEHEADSSNEIHRLNAATRALHGSIRILLRTAGSSKTVRM